MHDISRLSIYRQFESASKKQWAEAKSVYPFFIRLQDFIQVTDVGYGPDPPDFVLRSEGKKVGIELTLLTRRCGADSEQWRFGKWEKDTKRKPQRLHVFAWGEYRLREVLEALSTALAEKAAKAGAQKGGFDENWLLFNIGDGGPCGNCIEANFKPIEKLKKTALDCAAKFLYETKLICDGPHPFARMILTSGAYFLTFPSSDAGFKLTLANPALLRHGAILPEVILDRAYSLSSVRRHYDPSQGDVEAWLKMPLEKILCANGSKNLNESS